MLAQSTVFFDGWDNLARVLIVTPIMYVSVIAFVRLTGKRSTSQMNNFDWVVTVAIGSIIASPILLKDISVAEGVLAVGLLFSLQWVLTSLMVRSKLVSKIVRDSPSILVYRGELQRAAMKHTRVTEPEIMSAVRGSGHADLSMIGLVVLESDAKLSIIHKDNIEGFEQSQIGGLDVSAEQRSIKQGVNQSVKDHNA